MARAPSNAARKPRADPSICESSRRTGSSRRLAVEPWWERGIPGCYRNVGTDAAANRNVEPAGPQGREHSSACLEHVDYVQEDRRLVALEDTALLAEDVGVGPVDAQISPEDQVRRYLDLGGDRQLLELLGRARSGSVGVVEILGPQTEGKGFAEPEAGVAGDRRPRGGRARRHRSLLAAVDGVEREDGQVAEFPLRHDVEEGPRIGIDVRPFGARH